LGFDPLLAPYLGGLYLQESAAADSRMTFVSFSVGNCIEDDPISVRGWLSPFQAVRTRYDPKTGLCQ
jgi:hypothetical protein